MPTTLLQGGYLMTEHGLSPNGGILLEDGVVREVSQRKMRADRIIDVSRRLMFPGLIDIHTHAREPGLTHKETMATGSLSALHGGVTTMGEMFNTIPPTVTIEAFRDKVRIAAETAVVDMRFFFGITEPEHLREFLAMMDGDDVDMKTLRTRCLGVKLFLDHSTGDQKIDASMVGEVFAACAARDVQVMTHCEDPAINEMYAKVGRDGDVASHSMRRPTISEAASIDNTIQLAKEHKARLHIAHLSTGMGARLIEQAQNDGVDVTTETAPHYLFCTTDDYEALGTRIKMNPPIRTKRDRDALWHAIDRRVISLIGSDHAPHTIAEKAHADPLKAPSGVPGVETTLRLLLTVANGKSPRPDGWMPPVPLSFERIRQLMFDGPNKRFRLGKHDIAVGAKPDIVIVNPFAQEAIAAEHLHSKAGQTPYEGWVTQGKVEQVLRDGNDALSSLPQ